MGYLLKEALKTLCGVNQWSYAVFWKIGCQNPKLLIWEECYYGPIPYSGVSPMPGIENSNFTFRDINLGFQGGDRVQLLVNKMMLDNHVNVVGEGLVGRAAFTGNYHWILSQNYTKEFHPPEVSNEMHEQISAGMQTVAIIPVLPHGVVQLGSLSAITENLQFVNDVKSLILQLGYIPGVLLADNFATKEPSSEIGALVLENSASTSSGKSKVTHSTSYVTDIYIPQNDSPASRVDQTSNFLVRQIQDSLQPAGPNFQNHQLSDGSNSHAQAQGISNMKPMIDQRNKSENGMIGAEINSSNLNLWRHREPSFYIPGSMVNQQASLGLSATVSSSKIIEDKLLPDAYVGSSGLRDSNSFLAEWITESSIASSNTVSDSVPKHKPANQHNVMTSLSQLSNVSSLSSAHGLMKGHNLPVCFAESDFQSGSLNSTQLSSMSISQNLAPNHLSPSTSACKNGLQDKTCTQVDPDRGKEEMTTTMFHNISIPFPPIGNHMDLCDHSPSFVHESQKQNCGYQNMGNAQFEDVIVQSQSRDDLFDVFGMNFKNSILDENWNSLVHDRPVTITQTLDKNNHTLHKLQNACSEMQVIDEGNSDSGALCVTSTDHLLDAVVSSVQASTKQTSDDNISCKTTLTKISSAYAPTASTSKQANTSNQMQDVCIDLAKSLPNEGTFISSSFNYEPCKEESEIFSQTKSFYGSQSCSWVEQGPEIKKTTSSTAFSKRSDENSKSSRKRLKPGENPRPRPKDRQMIQDRVKELREIVPNSAKCSIDALLERTIKHMLFLQSVTKHADKLKQTGESKIINKEGGLLLKDNFEGGATWAYEVGSQSMVCPIIVEDLNQPRQMLVEMLCEERGLFLEIADIVRGLGLAILKGVMETRNDKIWARFAVEANRDVTRMEIFLSLVRLLGHTVKNSAVSANCISNCVSNDGAHQPFHPGVSIAATGRPCSFQ